MKKTQGFTLIELLVVIAIIGILSSVVLASLNSARAKARDAKRVSDLKQVQLALEMYYDDNTAYPADLASLGSSYIPTIPADPSGGAYTYDGSDTTTYCLSATIEGNVPEGDTLCDTAALSNDKIYSVSP